MCRKISILIAALLAITQISLAQVHIDVACSVTGTSPEEVGNTATYTLTGSCSATSWTVTCGIVESYTSISVTVYFGTTGCSSSVITAKNGSTTLASKTVTVTAAPALVCGSITNASQSINYNTTPAILSAGASSGGNCSSYSYQWYSSTNGTTFTGISGATGQNYQPGSLTVTTYFYRTTICTTQECTSNTATVTVYPQVQPGAVSPSTESINYNTSAGTLSVTGVSAGNGTYAYQWMSSPTSSGFTNISGATSATYSPGNLTSSTYYQVAVTSNGSAPVYATYGEVIVYPLISGTINPASQIVSYGNLPQQMTVTPAGGNGSYTYQWQSSPNGSSWTNIASATGASYMPPAGVKGVTYYQVLITSNGTYQPSTTAYTKPVLNPGMLTPADLTIASGTSPGQLDACPASGGNIPGSYTYQWELSSDGTHFTIISGATAQDYTPGVLSSNVWYRRRVTCSTDTAVTNNCQITIGTSTSNLNFIRSRTILKAGIMDTVTADGLTSPFDVAQTTQYVDNVGNVIQTVDMKSSPLQNDMVAPMVYDNFGRQAEQYLPYTASSSDGNYKPTAIQDQGTFNSAQYPGEQYYYSQTNFESSPFNRSLQSYPAGQSWVGNGDGFSAQYLINTPSDSVQIWNISSVQLSLPVNGGAYQAGQLFKMIMTDEQGHQMEEYKDKLGKTILKKQQVAASPSTGHWGWLCTYYVYDTLQNLRTVIQPQAVVLINGTWLINQTIANELCFRYEYDGRRRMTIQKSPGAGQVSLVHDARDRVVMMQDSSMRSQHKWLFAKYDAENRPDSSGFITDPTNYNNLAYYDTAAYYSTNFPLVSSYTNQLLTQSFYDDYSWVSAYSTPVGASMATNYTSNSNYFITSYNNSPTYAVTIKPFAINRGMPTGMMKTVIGGSTSQNLYTSVFYDDRGRTIQTQSMNYTGAIDTITLQYNFAGTVLRSLLNHKKALNTIQNHTVVTKMDYDHRFRLRHIWKNIDNAPSDQLIDSLQYNELGQLNAKYLGNQLDSMIYSYNIRGWLTGINKNYVAGTTNHYFGMELGYDKTTSVAPGNTYVTPEYNGNIEGVVWKSSGSGINRKYDYTYDEANRLSAAAFLQNTSGSSWDNNQINYSVSGLTYDANGNILTMTQRGFAVGGSTPIDSLAYGYLGIDSSNKLMGVTDAANNDTSLLGDFHYNHLTKQPTDYNYDINGRQTHDNNRNIDTITYNYMNLPQLIHMKGKGNVAYVYDASGTKLSKIITDSLIQRITTINYIQGFVYQQTATFSSPNAGVDTLQFLVHEQGRVRWAFQKFTTGNTAYSYQYDFFETDHLGNTRMVLTQERDTTNYLATMEAANRSTEEQLFGNITTTCAAWTSMPNYMSIPNATRYLYGTTNDSVSKVDSSSAGGQKMGPSLLLKVMSGDSVNISVQSYYTTPAGGSNNYSSFNDVLTSLGQGLVNLTGGGHGTLGTLETPGSSVFTGLSSFLSTDDTAHSGYPKAYINYIFLDDQFNYVSSLSGSVLAASSTYPANQMNLVGLGSKLALNRNGYLYIWVSNETSGWDVFFDNLSVQYLQGPVLEENHYYPFGLTMAALSDKAIKTSYAENKFRYNSGSELQNKEFNDGTGLEMYEMPYRGLDPQLGRFTAIDPLANSTPDLSPYQFADDKPESSIDPTGAKQKLIMYQGNNPRPGGGGGAGNIFLDGFGGDNSDDGTLAGIWQWGANGSIVGGTGDMSNGGDGADHGWGDLSASGDANGGSGSSGNNTTDYSSFWNSFLANVNNKIGANGAYSGNFSTSVNAGGNSVIRIDFSYGIDDGSGNVLNTDVIGVLLMTDNPTSPSVMSSMFKFTNQKWNWQEAGVMNLTMHAVFDNGKAGTLQIPFTLYFGMPQYRGTGNMKVYFSNSVAASDAAFAVNWAGAQVIDASVNNPALTAGDLQKIWISDMQEMFGTNQGTVMRKMSTNAMVIVTDAKSSF